MAKETKTPPTKDLRELANKAGERKNILPKVDFGQRLQEGEVILTFLQDTPEQFTYKNKLKDGIEDVGLSLHVRVHHSAYGQSPGEFQLVLNSDPTHSLTSGILKLWDANQESLKGVTIKVSKYVYKHKSWGDTSGYNVQLADPPM